MPRTRSTQITVEGDPADIKPRNRRERRAQAKLLRAHHQRLVARGPETRPISREVEMPYIGKRIG